MIRLASSLLATLGAISTVSAHASIYHPSMYGFNVTAETFGRDFRPHVPLDHELFKDWWFHGHLDYPPHDGDVFELPAGGTAVAEIACHKSATSYWNTSESLKDGRQGNYPCPGQPLAAFHTTGRDGVTGCAMAIVDKANVHDIKPEDFTIFSVNHACVWTRDTEFPVPAKMPACKDGVCHCAWFWIHSPNSGSMQMYMTGFKCKVTNTNESARKIGKPSLARRCHDPEIGFDEKNCTVGPKQPLYWYQKEGNTFFEDTYHPPLYNDLYDFKHGAQEDIFTDEPGYWEKSNGVVVAPEHGAPATTTSVTAATSTSTTSSQAAVISSTSSLSSSSSISSTNAAASTTSSEKPATTGTKQESNQGLIDTEVPKNCVRRTPEQKRKRAMKRAAKAAREHHRRFGTGLRSLFGGL